MITRIISAGQVAGNLLLSAGNGAVVSSGGSVTNGIIGGGMLIVSAGGETDATTVASGGTIELFGGTLSGVSFASGATLVFSGGSIAGLTLAPGALLDDLTTSSVLLDPVTGGLTISNGGTATALPAAGSATTAVATTAVATTVVASLPDPSGSGSLMGLATNSGVTSLGNGAMTVLAGDDQVLCASGGLIEVCTGCNDMITLTSGGTIETQAGVSDLIETGQGASTIGGDGHSTVFGDAGAETVSAGAGGDIVVGGAGGLTFIAGNGNSVVVGGGGSGGLSYTGNTANDTVIGNGTASIITGGIGGGTYIGGGNSVVSAGSGAAAALIGRDGDKLYSNGNAGDTFAVLGGGVTMDGSASTGNDIFYATLGTGACTFITGSGNDIIGLAQGTNQVKLGTGTTTVYANTGNAGVSFITAGTGSANIALGGQSVDLAIAAASARAPFSSSISFPAQMPSAYPASPTIPAPAPSLHKPKAAAAQLLLCPTRRQSYWSASAAWPAACSDDPSCATAGADKRSGVFSHLGRCIGRGFPGGHRGRDQADTIRRPFQSAPLPRILSSPQTSADRRLRLLRPLRPARTRLPHGRPRLHRPPAATGRRNPHRPRHRRPAAGLHRQRRVDGRHNLLGPRPGHQH
jgi:Ca2+-binding RTX toxin-like protein